MLPTSNKQSGFFAFFKEVVVLILIVFAIRTFVFGLYQVPTGSMETTMLVGERFFADKFTYLFRSPRRNEIIAFNDPTFAYSTNPLVRLWQDYVGKPLWNEQGFGFEPANWTKRVIGLPGQTIEGKIEEGKPVVYVDGVKLDEPYLNQYPLIRVYPTDQQKIFNKAKKEAEQLILGGRLSVANLQRFMDHQAQCSAKWKSYDPDRPFDDQPFYDINPDRVVKNEDGEPQLKWPGTPLPDRENCFEKEPVKNGKNFWNGTDEFYVELGPTQYWAMGDNREGSYDSRFFGPIDKRLIHGKIVFRIWSNDSAEGWWIVDLFRHPIKFWKQMRWNRFFHFL